MNRLIFIAALIVPGICSAQYKGGSDDGYSIINTGLQNGLPNIYTGGTDDGASSTTANSQNALPNIYKGGQDDGVYTYEFKGAQNTQPNIYVGGSNDGTSSTEITAANALPNIYSGGRDDGAAIVFAPTQNTIPNIYVGGQDDGHAFTSLTNQNALPNIYAGGRDDGYSIAVSLTQNPSEQSNTHARQILVLQLSGQWFNDDAVLAWKATQEESLDHMELERSTNGETAFTFLASVNQNEQPGQDEYRHTDAHAYTLPADYLLYRLKCVYKNGDSKYSAVVRLDKDKTMPVIAAYPNPTSGRFTLELMNVTDISGYAYVLSGVDGRIIARGDIHEAKTALDVSKQAVSTYYLFVYRNGKPIQHFTILLTQ
jgi:hypothetical protein